VELTQEQKTTIETADTSFYTPPAPPTPPAPAGPPKK
jgi:hypothetical protein